ncbi:type II secretion system protein [Candidatus Woesebacteria bacterium]|nr:type II secretion system protein [Candidatus Woesebacteria bacterium]
MGDNRGFTLIELLVVIGILAILLAITLVAINPAQNLQQAETQSRRSGATQMLNAINQYMVDNNGDLPAGLGGVALTPIPISDTGANICAELVPDYIAALPEDGGDGIDSTECAATYTTGYAVSVDTTANRVKIDNIADNTISVMR